MKTSYKTVKRWYLEMNEPLLKGSLVLPEHLFIRQFKGSISEYRHLNQLVGADLGWVDRLLMADEDLEKILQNSETKIFELHVKEKLSGFAELDFSVKDEVEMHYFGLVPEARGKGFGKPFLHCIIAEAWKSNPKKLILNTCEIDHPDALPMYLKAGFTIVDERIEKQAVISEK